MANDREAEAEAAQRPRVAVLYSHASAASREGEQSAKYVGLCLAVSGHCEKVSVVGLDLSQKQQQGDDDSGKPNVKATTKALRSDGLVIDAQTLSSEQYEETLAYQVLAKYHVWILLLDADATANSMQFLQKRIKKADKKQPKRSVVSLQTTLRQLSQLDHGFADSIVLHGGLGFQVVKDDQGVLSPLSQGCYYIERLPKEKMEALFVLDMLEGTGLQVLSRRNIQGDERELVGAGEQLLAGKDQQLDARYDRLHVPVDPRDHGAAAASGRALPRDSSIRRLWIEQLSERQFGDHVSLTPCVFFLSFDAQSDLASNLETGFAAEFQDVFELANNRSTPLPVLSFLKSTLDATVQAKAGVPRIVSSVMVTQVKLSPQSRAASRLFLLKLIVTVVATVLLGSYLFLR